MTCNYFEIFFSLKFSVVRKLSNVFLKFSSFFLWFCWSRFHFHFQHCRSIREKVWCRVKIFECFFQIFKFDTDEFFLERIIKSIVTKSSFRYREIKNARDVKRRFQFKIIDFIISWSNFFFTMLSLHFRRKIYFENDWRSYHSHRIRVSFQQTWKSEIFSIISLRLHMFIVENWDLWIVCAIHHHQKQYWLTHANFDKETFIQTTRRMLFVVKIFNSTWELFRSFVRIEKNSSRDKKIAVRNHQKIYKQFLYVEKMICCNFSRSFFHN